MGKPKKALQPETPHKTPLKAVKEGQVKKHKVQKFKQTPAGKVPLINGSSSANGVQKAGKKPQKPQLPNKNQKPVKKSKLDSPKKGKKKDESEEEDDINEGISITEDVSLNEADDSEASSDEDTPNILGESLANDSDEDDDDFEASDDEEEEEEDDDEAVNKGVKMFKGSKKMPAKAAKSSSEDEDDDDSEEDEDEDEDDDEVPVKKAKTQPAKLAKKEDKKGDKSKKTSQLLVKKEIKREQTDEDEDDDEEEVPVKKTKTQPAKPAKKEDKSKKVPKLTIKKEIKQEETDEDEDEEEDDDELSKTTSLNSSVNSGEDSDEDSDEDEEEDEDEGPGLKALLGDSLVDQDDDEDFDVSGEDDEDDEDEDISGEENDTSRESEASDKNQSNDSARFNLSDGETPKLSAEQKAERDRRTIYLGNVPKDLTEKELRKAFKQFGAIESVRVRGIVPENSKITLKEAAAKKKFHPLSKSLCVYLIYKDEGSVEKALTMNGQKLGGNYLRVDRIGQQKPADPKKSVFLGNLPFGIEDNELWEVFGQCGKIDYVRTVRDRRTGCCRGAGYINYFDEDSATLALDLNGKKIKGREVRVSRYDPNRAQSPKKPPQKRPFPGKSQGSPKKAKTQVETATHNSVNAEKRKLKKEKSFQGQKAEGKKKFKKPGPFEQKKKTLAAKLLAKPKKVKVEAQ